MAGRQAGVPGGVNAKKIFTVTVTVTGPGIRRYSVRETKERSHGPGNGATGEVAHGFGGLPRRADRGGGALSRQPITY
jgi:hypothetical protein